MRAVVQARLDPAIFPFGLPDTSTELERRQEPRVRCHKVVEIVPGAELHAWTGVRAELTDCTCHGLGLLLGRSMVVGEQFVLRLALSPPRLLIYTVCHVRASDDGRWQIGAEFSGFFAVPSSAHPSQILEALLAQ